MTYSLIRLFIPPLIPLLIHKNVHVFSDYSLHPFNHFSGFYSVCPESFKPLAGCNTCYKTMFKGAGVNWTAAGQLCDELFNGSYRAVITSAVENIAIAQYAAQEIIGNCFRRNFN